MGGKDDKFDEFTKGFQAEIKTFLKATELKIYLAGVHLRHALDNSSPRVELVSSESEDKPKSTHNSNKEKGYHTLNHVLDSLYYRESETNLFICLRVNFGLQNEDIMHCFDLVEECNEEKHQLSEQLNPSGSGDSSIPKDRMPLFDPHNSFTLKYATVGLKKDATEKLREDNNTSQSCSGDDSPDEGLGKETTGKSKKERDAIQISSENYSLDKAQYADFICGITRLCQKLGIHFNSVTCKSIISSLEQLSKYTGDSNFGYHGIILLARSSETFGHAIGVSIISKMILEKKQLINLVQAMLAKFRSRNQQNYLDVYKPFGFKGNCTENVRSTITDHLINSPNGLNYSVQTNISRTVGSFLNLVTEFCDERLEGRPLCFGFILGNIGLLKFWPGQIPSVINSSFKTENGPADSSKPNNDTAADSTLPISKLPKQSHLLESPSECCLVIPYLSITADKNQTIPCDVVEFSDYQESFSSWSSSSLWTPDLKPYAYLTNRFPWAVGAVVGPGSQIRVFADGDLLAYRDGKGWRFYRGLSGLICDNKGWNEAILRNGAEKAMLDSLISLSKQLSPIARELSHGGLIVYVPELDEEKCIGFFTEHSSELNDFEPASKEGNKWLTGQEILIKTESGGFEMSPTLARRVLRAGTLDGAIVFTGKMGHLRYFGRQLNFTKSGENGNGPTPSGTKHAAAHRFVAFMKEKSYPMALAIAISSDGPIKILFSTSEENVKSLELFTETSNAD